MIPRAPCTKCGTKALWCAGCGAFVCAQHDTRAGLGFEAHERKEHDKEDQDRGRGRTR